MKDIELIVRGGDTLHMAFDDDGSKVFIEGRCINGWADVDSIPHGQRESIKDAFTKLDAIQSELFDMLATVQFSEIEMPG